MSDNFLQRGFNADLEHFELTDIMQLITQQLKSGILTVKSKEGNCSWSFSDGQLVGFSCHFPNYSIDLESILVNSGLLKRRQFEQLVERHSCRSTLDLEKALIEEELITREKLEEINLRRLIETFIICLQWTKGQYRFIPTTEITSQEFFTPQDANFVTLEALRQIDEMAIMEERLQPLDRRFKTALNLIEEDAATDKPGKAAPQPGPSPQFDLDELEVYNLFDGRRSLDEILNISTLGRFHTCRIVINFLDRGIIVPPTGELAGYRDKLSQIKFYQYATAFTLVVFCLCLLVSIFLAGSSLTTRARKNFFHTLVGNIRSVQKKQQDMARDLLLTPASNNSEPADTPVPPPSSPPASPPSSPPSPPKPKW